MDFSLWFTQQGHAIHMGNDDAMSHGCIHVGEKGAKSMFNWAKKNHTKVVITREHFMPSSAKVLTAGPTSARI